MLLTVFGLSLTFLLIYILNPDKEPLPWRGYCTIPRMTTGSPPSVIPPTVSFPFVPPQDFTPPSFPPDNFDTLSPAGVFVGVFSMDAAVERRMHIRTTFASHPRSRNGAGEGDGGEGTSRTIVRFILGQPRKDWERRIQLEMESTCFDFLKISQTHPIVPIFSCLIFPHFDILINSPQRHDYSTHV